MFQRHMVLSRVMDVFVTECEILHFYATRDSVILCHSQTSNSFLKMIFTTFLHHKIL